ncbi:MAG: ABC transporter permease [Clostridium sp.]|nr:ABC transporter permease [Clostridium sp.]
MRSRIRSYIKEWTGSRTRRQLRFAVSGAISCLFFLCLYAITIHLIREQPAQRMAQRWSDQKDVAQISCFFSAAAGVDEDALEMFRHSLDSALLEAAISAESPRPGARLWADAYSAGGRITLSSERASLETEAVGIGGDFFLFHPQQLLDGAYFSGNDLMQDYCVIDQDAAWQLFGSNDVAGMTVSIQGIPHIVAGVVRREEGKLYETAGLDSTLVYVSCGTLEELGTSRGISHYEIVMPNPVAGYAYGYVKEQLGAQEGECEIIENTLRYRLLPLWKLLGEFASRSMHSKAIAYPYWENVARGYEDMLAILMLLELLFLLYPAVLLCVALISWWKHKKWTFRSVYGHWKDRLERRMEKWRRV